MPRSPRHSQLGRFFIVATPIGNLTDLSLRAKQTLESVALIACEDTRQTGQLLHHLGFRTPLLHLDQRRQLTLAAKLYHDYLARGLDVALVSDAGTPAINDPGGQIVEALLKLAQSDDERLEVIPIPGASALTAALSVAGVPAERFVFLGFLPKKKGRQTLLKQLVNYPELGLCTIVCFESMQRIVKTVADFQTIWISRYGSTANQNVQLIVLRELTKLHEEIWRGPLADWALTEHRAVKGEVVLILDCRNLT